MDLYKLGWESAKQQNDYQTVKETPSFLRQTGVEYKEEETPDVEREDDPDFDRDREGEDLAEWEDDSNDL